MKLSSFSYTLILTGFIGISPSVFAETPTQFIKKVYADALDDDMMGEDIVKIHAAPELRRLISRLDQVHSEEEWEMCDWSYDHQLVPGNDFDTKLSQMNFSTLANGRVRAQGRNFGKTFHVDFEVKCTDGSCKINDMFSPTGYKQALNKIIKYRNC